MESKDGTVNLSFVDECGEVVSSVCERSGREEYVFIAFNDAVY